MDVATLVMLMDFQMEHLGMVKGHLGMVILMGFPKGMGLDLWMAIPMGFQMQGLGLVLRSEYRK